MAKIFVNTDCGSALKKEFLKLLSISFVKRDVDFILKSLNEDIMLNIVGYKLIQGKSDLSEILGRFFAAEFEELKIDNILTHGKEGAVNGTVKIAKGKEYAFCNIYKFTGAKGDKVKSIISYVIELKQ